MRILRAVKRFFGAVFTAAWQAIGPYAGGAIFAGICAVAIVAVMLSAAPTPKPKSFKPVAFMHSEPVTLAAAVEPVKRQQIKPKVVKKKRKARQNVTPANPFPF